MTPDHPSVMFDWLHDFLKRYFARTIFRAKLILQLMARSPPPAID